MITRKAAQMLGAHFARIGGTNLSRIDASEHAWSAAYRIEVPKGTPWGSVSAVLETMSEDDALLKEIGRRLTVQVVCEFALSEAKGRFAYKEYASMSLAQSAGVAFAQASAQAYDYQRRYKNARVFSVIVYFR